jgi:lipoic acid synthetase
MMAQLELAHLVITSVDRDDLADQGAGHFAAVIREVKQRRPDMLVEVLIPDFRGDRDLVQVVASARPDVIAHNVETVERLTPRVRDPRATYRQSLDVLAAIKAYDPSIATKTSLMLGLGETQDEVAQTLRDLRDVNCEIVTFGQYLQPTAKHLPVEEYVTPEAFDAYAELGKAMGFRYVASGPLVRSSYRAGELFIKGMIEERRATHAQ